MWRPFWLLSAGTRWRVVWYSDIKFQKNMARPTSVYKRTCAIRNVSINLPKYTASNYYFCVVVVVVVVAAAVAVAVVVVSCQRIFLPGASSLEPTVIPTAQASRFRLQYFPCYVWCSKYSLSFVVNILNVFLVWLPKISLNLLLLFR